MFKVNIEKVEEPEVKLSTSAGSSKKQESARKTSTSALLTSVPQSQRYRDQIANISSEDVGLGRQRKDLGKTMGALSLCDPVFSSWVASLFHL